ncbi:MAG: mechanosensitive ion channel [Saprospiraceae bacterium]|nr:mechanosensitive ion channel [Saprospiraceae bacterium]
MKVILQFETMKDALYNMLSKLVNTVPDVVSAILIFVIGYIISKMISKAVKKAISKVGIDKVGEKLNEIDIVQKMNMEIKISTILSKTLYYFLMLLFAVASTSVLGIPEISNLFADIFNFIPRLVVALIVLILGTLIADALRKMVHTGLKSLGVSSAGILSSVVFYFLFINIVISALSQAEINTEFLAQNISIIIGGVIAAFAIGYGLASKDIMANMIASFYSGSQFKVGDKITIDDVTGVISKIDKSSITIKTETGRVMFPLNKAVNQKVEFHD